MENKLHILSTAPLEESLIKRVKEAGIQIDIVSFIETASNINETKAAAIEQLYNEQAVVVFTSANAVKYIPEIDCTPNWKIYCIGYATKKAASEKFGDALIQGAASNAKELADIIIQNRPDEVLFFCGDKRRDELPDKLSEARIKLKEIVVYTTLLTPQTINRKYDGILFFSPSAVESYLQANRLSPDTTLFAIGSTTAGAIENACGNTVITGNIPDKKELIATMLSYYESVISSK